MSPKRSPSPSTGNITKKLKLNKHLDFQQYINFTGKHYPNNVSIKTANEWNNGKRKKPIDIFNSKYNPSKLNKDEKYLVHLFKNDLRIQDNTSLYNLIEDAKKINAKPIGLYIISTKFWNAHFEGAFKINFIQRALKSLKESLLKLNIPLSVVYLDDENNEYKLDDDNLKTYPAWFSKLINEKFQTNSVYYNLNYEYDEFNRDISLLSTDLNIKAFHDQCIVKPMELTSGKGTQYSKFSPWFKKWDQYLSSNPFELLHIKDTNFTKWDWSFLPNDDIDNLKLDSHFTLDSLKELGVTDSDLKEFQKFHIPTEKHALKLLDEWSDHITNYQSHKDFPAEKSTSRLSPYIHQGIISTRTIVDKATKLNKNKRIGGDKGIETYIKEVAWRDFYRHVMINWPYLMMFIPFNFGFKDLNWDNNYSKFEKWAMGETGFPIVDAAMKQLLHTGYMNNRCRMIVASFLAKDLAIDWRIGERWFYNHLADADLASNNGGWGFSSSTGLDAQPWFRIFNVYTQSEKFDPNGDFIKKWLPQLSKLDNFHEPYNEKSNHEDIAKITNDYPKPIVDRKEAREETLERYREAS